MPTISDLKDQARGLEQQGQIDRALTIYQHILKHLEGTPAITKVLPLYVKAGDLLHKLDRPEEAVASYQTAAEHYASSGAASRVTALCGKILRLVPDRTDVYTDFARQLISHGHAGSARDVLADYARFAGMDRAMETLDDLAGRPNAEVQPMLERLLESLEEHDQSEQAAARVSSHLERATDVLAGELSTVPDSIETDAEETEQETPAETDDSEEQTAVAEDEGPADEGETVAEQGSDDRHSVSEPLTPPMFDLDNLPRQSSLHRAIDDYNDTEPLVEEADEVEETEQDASDDAGADTPDLESDSGFDITRDVTPTMDGMPVPVEALDEDASEAKTSENDELDTLLADALSADDTSEEENSSGASEPLEIETSQWTPDFSDPNAEEPVAAEWAPEEELEPSARYPSDEYETPETEDESVDETEQGPEQSEPIEEETEPPIDAGPATPPTTEPEPEAARRPSRPPRMMVPEKPQKASKSPILFGIGGLIVGALAGAGLTFVLLGGGSGSTPTPVPAEQPAAVVDTPTTRTQTPAPGQVQPAVPASEAVAGVDTEAAALDSVPETPTDSSETTQPDAAEPSAPEEITPDSGAAETATQQITDPGTAAGNPIVVEGMDIDEISEIEFRGLFGYRVVHLLDWVDDPIVIEAYRDTSVSLSNFIQVDVTPPDTVVGIRRLDGYMVYASGVMPEDSLRSLMSRLVEGERPE